MRITVIGSGSAYGVPTVGGYWGDCNPDNPKNRRTGPSITVESDTTKILVDLSADFREQSERHAIRDLDAILFTHGHADHIMGNFHLPMMMRYFNEKNLPLYALDSTRNDIEKVFWYQHTPGMKVNYSGQGRPYWENVEPYESFTVGDIAVMPVAQEHGSITSLGFGFGNFAYSTDFNAFPEETYKQLEGLDCWLVECNSLTRKKNSVEVKHQFLENILTFVERIKPKQTYLTHMDTTMDYDSVKQMLPDGVDLAYDGLVLDFPSP